MTTQFEQTANEIDRLRRCMTDLLGLLALPAMWAGGDLRVIARILLDVLLGMLNVDFLYLRLVDEDGTTVIEMARTTKLTPPMGKPSDVGPALLRSLGTVPANWPQTARVVVGNAVFSTMQTQLGLGGEVGVLVAGSSRSIFPRETERLLLNVAGNQIAIAVKEVCLLSEQTRHAAELDRRVAQRTAELAATNQALKQEIAERRRAEEALRDSENSSRMIVDSIAGLVAILTPEGEVEVVNSRVVEYCGITLDEFKQGTGETVHPEDRAQAVAEFTNAIKSGEPYDFEARIKRFDGIYRWFQVRGLPFRDANGGIVRWYALLTDTNERKCAEEALSASERNLSQIINTIPALAWSARPDGAADFFNRHYLDYLGLSSERARDWGWAAALHPDEGEELMTTWRSMMAAGMPGEAEARLRRFDGTYRWFLFRMNPLRDEQGSIVKWYGTNTDIDDRKRAEEELRRSEAFLAQGQRLTLTGSMWWKVSTGEIIWSDETYRLAEYPRTISPTMELMIDRCHPEDVSRVRELVARSANEGTNMAFEHRLVMQDGSVKHVDVVLQNIAGKMDKPEFVGAVTDVTERKKAEERLRRSEMLLAAGQRISLSGTFSWRVDTDEITFSDELNRIFEFDDDVSVTPDRIIDRVHPEDQPILAEKMEQVRCGRDNPEYEIRLWSRDDSIKYVRVVGRVIRHKDGRLECLGAVQDVTQRRRAEEARDKIRSELAHVTRVMSLGAMTASIAHEVNQPLSGIITNAGTCLRMLAADPPNVAGALETARRTIRDGNRAADVIARLRALFRRSAAVIEPVDLNEAAREVIALLSTDLRRSRVDLRVELADGLPFVGGDRVQLQQVILNLLRNAVDAMNDIDGRQRHLLIRTELGDGESVRLSVRDTGEGFGSREADRLFDAFFTTKNEGMGIGLSVSRSIIESHKGRIWTAAHEGPGATIAFCIPQYSTTSGHLAAQSSDSSNILRKAEES
jgi:PAS domain S-box-containing protein